MRRLLLTLALLALPVLAHAQQRPMLLIQDNACTAEACTQGFQWCEQSGSATLYHCDTTTGFYVQFGGVIGPSSSVDNEIVRFNGTTGKLIQAYTSNGPTVSDIGAMNLTAQSRWQMTADASAIRLLATGAGNSPYMIFETSGNIGAAMSVDSSGDWFLWEDTSPFGVGLHVDTQTGDDALATMDVHAASGDFVLDVAGTTFQDGTSGAVAAVSPRVVHICDDLAAGAGGCEYTNLNDACTNETSTASAPIVFWLHAGVYTARVTTCTGQDHAAIVGDGIYATEIDVENITTAGQGALDLGTSTNMTVSDMTIEGTVGIMADGTEGDLFFSRLKFKTDNVAAVAHCVRVTGATTATRVFYDDIVCETHEEGFTIGVNGGNYEVYERNAVILNTSDNDVNNLGFCWNFGSAPAFFYSKDAVCKRTHDGGDAFDFGCMNTKQNQSGGSSAAIYEWHNLVCNLHSTAAAGNDVDVYGFLIDTDVTGTGIIRLIEPQIDVLVDSGTGGSADGDAYGVRMVDTAATTTVEIYGGRVDAGTSVNGEDFDDNAASSGRIKLLGTKFSTYAAIGDLAPLEFGRFGNSLGAEIDVEDANAGRWLFEGTTQSRTAIMIRHSTTTDTVSPTLEFCNDTNEDECVYLSVDTDGNLEFRDDAGALLAEVDADGDLHVDGTTGDLKLDGDSPDIWIGDGNNTADPRILFRTSNAATITYDQSDFQLNLGAIKELELTPIATAPATCTEGSIYADDSGALCYCETANTWTSLGGSGACT